MNRRHRLRGRAAFAAVRARRASSSVAMLRVGVAANAEGCARVGYAIPRAVGGSVVRNRVRRRLREALRPRLADLAGLDVVVSAHPGAGTATWHELTAALDRGLVGARGRLLRDGGSTSPRTAAP